LLGTPVLGVIPEVPGTGGPDERLRLARITHIRPDGEVAGAFSSLAAEVCYGRPFRDGRLLLVTSPNRGDGKSTVAANLAIAAAHAGRRTLLLDADFRRPIQHLVFDVQGNLGVADVVLDGFGIDQVVRPTDVRGLFLLPAGALAGNPVELIGGRPFAELLAGLEERFDLVVIDAPPLLATGDARVLAAHADGAIVVLRAERSTRQAARLACERVLGVGCTLLGLAFNGDDAVATAPHADGRGANDDWVAAAPVRRSPFHRAAAIAPGLIPAVAIATVDRDGVTERLHNGLQATSGGGRVARGPGVV
jgi:succinoglycan biosynthesis transport protein ExoP